MNGQEYISPSQNVPLNTSKGHERTVPPCLEEVHAGSLSGGHLLQDAAVALEHLLLLRHAHRCNSIIN